ncbi:MAG: transglycosylase domain-containing protein [Candidatus Edwardsbacteria bacterium]|nr:transglycosylase domain-containing protein [Candidatus Edwardsbacteria bacterium]
MFSEDRRFCWHCGIDPLSFMRASRQNIKAGKTVSGGSTLTMQLARIFLGPRPRGPRAKAQERLRSAKQVADSQFARAYGVSHRSQERGNDSL